MRKYITLLLCIIFCCGLLSAQGRIDKVIDSMEGKPDVETTYTERRSPKKKKLIMTSRIFNFDNSYYFERLKKAFEEERANSISAVKTKNQMTYRFDDDKGVSTYTLSWNGDRGPFTMVMTWRSSDANDSSYIMEDASDFDSCDFDKNNIIVGTVDACGGSMSLTYVSDGDGYCYYVNNEQNRDAAMARREAAKARCEAAKARQKAAEARQEAAKARCEAAKARAEARRKASKARAEARKSAAKARREAARAHRASLSSDLDKSERIYDLASRSRCRMVSPSGNVIEMSALDALDNDIVWSALEEALDSNKRTITTTSVSGSTTTVIIEPEPKEI